MSTTRAAGPPTPPATSPTKPPTTPPGAPQRAAATATTGPPAPPRPLAWLLALGGLLGTLAAAVLTVEKVVLLQDPSYLPTCSINPVLSCGSVMLSDQADVLGFPNSLIGLVAFPVVATLGVLAVARVRLPGWVWGGLALGALAGAGFVQWLAFQSLYRIGALCPYCLVVWAVTVPIAFSVTAYVGHRRADRLPPPVRRAVGLLWEWRSAVTAGWFLLVGVLALERFWPYWSTLL